MALWLGLASVDTSYYEDGGLWKKGIGEWVWGSGAEIGRSLKKMISTDADRGFT